MANQERPLAQELNRITYVIHSRSEGQGISNNEKVGAFWSRNDGWGSLEAASRFPTFDRMNGILPSSKAGDSEWMILEEALDLTASPNGDQKPCRPRLGSTANAILDMFKLADRHFCGRYATRAQNIGSSLTFCWEANGKLGVVVGEMGVRDATDAEYDELEESIELGQVQISLMTRRFSPMVVEVLHQATGLPLDENSKAAIAQRNRWNRAYPGTALRA